ncbi:MAG: glycosyltransferase family 4 protein [Paludibacteraceae bacterium]|nr:glycosyltransferase family 4 protein [Paludibacteraceae bacterium]
MKVLFCSPYLNSHNVIKGGINTWGNYVFSYWKEYGMDDVELIPISFDRYSRDVGEVTNDFISRIISAIRELKSSFILAIKTMKQEHPDVIHLCTSASLSLFKDIILIYIAKKNNIKTVLHFHFGRIPELQKQNNWEWKLLLIIAKKVDVPIVMDGKSLDALKKQGVKNVAYLPNPLSENVLKYCDKNHNINRIPNQLLFVGHVLKSKGVIELVEGCMNIPNVTLHIVGKYTEDIRQSIETIAKRRNNGNWVKFFGEIPHEEVLQQFFTADIFVFPSYTEGFPNVILEAMACGCPIVSSNVGAIPEMLNINHNNACGICFPPQNAEFVKNSVNRILNDEIQKREFSENAKHRVREEYTMSKIWNQLTKIWS